MRTETHDLSGRNIFLTGGTGAVGRTLLDYLSKCENAHGRLRVTVLTRSAEYFAQCHPAQANYPWLTLLSGSLEDLPPLPPGTTDVIHAAAATHAQSGHAAWIDQIVGGTSKILEMSARRGIDRFLLLSSGAVYGPQPRDLSHVSEDYLGAPDPRLASSTYGQAKRAAEQLCCVFNSEHGVQTVSARLFAFGSVHLPRDGRYALGSLVRDALADGDTPIRITGDGTAVRSYLDGHDMAHALIVALVAGERGAAYNIGSNAPVTIAELARTVRNRLAPDRKIVVLGNASTSERSRYVPDVARIGALGAAMRSDLFRTIDDTAGR